MTLARARVRWTLKQRVFAASDEISCSQIEDQTSIHLFIEVEMEGVERFLRITKLRLLSSSLEQGTYSSPLLLAASAHLLRRLRSSA